MKNHLRLTMNVKDNLETPMIRVLLMDSDYESYYHEYVEIEYEEKRYCFNSFNEDCLMGDLYFKESTKGIAIPSIERQCGTPIYKGSLEIKQTPKGYLLINELPLETYLQAVIPSEMPASYEMEALKAQSVCARTYAWKQMQEGRLKEYDAHVDDSVQFQVYQNLEPSERSDQAVKETEGQVMTYDDELIEAYYFSTSAGATSTDEIWGKEKGLPYLQSVECSFDSMEPWAKWSTSISWGVLNDRILEYNPAGGKLKALEILKKSESGAVTLLKVIQEQGSSEFINEYDIRHFLSSKDMVIIKKDGTRMSGTKLLPSAYFTLEMIMNESVEINGGGYGHGIGMSQNAANQMAKKGYDYQEILHYFFNQISIKEYL